MTRKTKESVEARLLRAMEEAAGIAKGTRAASRRYAVVVTSRDAVAEPLPAFASSRVTRIRTRLGLSQAVFADALGVSTNLVQAWEQGDREPRGAAARLLQIAEVRPEVVLGFVRGRDGAARESTRETLPRRTGARARR